MMMMMRMMMCAGVPIGFDEVMFCSRDPVTSPVDSVLPPLEVIDNPNDVDDADLSDFDGTIKCHNVAPSMEISFRNCQIKMTSPVDSVLPPLEVIDNPNDV